ncbi:hypothetical protein VTO73DRAFT_12665 [Trametes versicolor]
MPDPRVRALPLDSDAQIARRSAAGAPRLAARQADSASLTSTVSSSTSGSTAASTTSASASATSDTPLFPSPTNDPNECVNCETDNSIYTKRAVEGALIVVAVALVLTMLLWRIIRLRRTDRPLRDFFRALPDSPPHRSVSRPSHVPRTTGLPPTRGPPAHLIYDSLTTPVPLMHHSGPRRGRGRRTYAGDIGVGGRRGAVAHPDDPNEFLPEYDDKDRLPRYQDLEAAAAARIILGADLGRVDDAGRMVGVGTGLGRRPNGEAGQSDTDLLVGEPLSAVSEDEHAYPPMSSTGSHEGHSSNVR